MERALMKELAAWKSRLRRKPLLLRGARQTGKTWLLKELGRSSFQSMAYVDLLANSRAPAIFDDDFDIQRIVTALSVETGTRITAGDTSLSGYRDEGWLANVPLWAIEPLGRSILGPSDVEDR